MSADADRPAEGRGRLTTPKGHGAPDGPDGAIPSPAGTDPAAASPPPPRLIGRIRSGLYSRTFESLSNRHFRFLLGGMLLSMGGAQMQMVVRTIFVFELTGDYVITGLVTMGFAPAMFVFSLIGGVAGDKLERRTLIQAVQVGSAVVAAIIGFLIWTGQVHWGHMLVASMMQGMMFAFQMPARQVMIPRLVGRERLSNAMALNATGMSMMTMAAPGAAGILYSVIGPDGAYGLIAVMNLLAVILTGFVPRMFPDPDRPKRSAVSEIRAGFAYISGNQMVMILMLHSVLVTLLSMPFRMLLPAFALDVYDALPDAAGWLLAANGAGAMIAGLGIASLRRGQRRGLVLMGSALFTGVALVAIGAFPWYLVGMLAMVLMGVGHGAGFGLGPALIMENADEEYRGRVMSVFMMTFGLMPLGVLPLSLAIDHFGPQAAVLTMGLMLLVVASLLIATQGRLRRLQ